MFFVEHGFSYNAAKGPGSLFVFSGEKGSRKLRHTPTIPRPTESHRELFVGNMFDVSLQAKFKV